MKRTMWRRFAPGIIACNLWNSPVELTYRMPREVTSRGRGNNMMSDDGMNQRDRPAFLSRLKADEHQLRIQQGWSAPIAASIAASRMRLIVSIIRSRSRPTAGEWRDDPRKQKEPMWMQMEKETRLHRRGRLAASTGLPRVHGPSTVSQPVHGQVKFHLTAICSQSKPSPRFSQRKGEGRVNRAKTKASLMPGPGEEAEWGSTDSISGPSMNGLMACGARSLHSYIVARGANMNYLAISPKFTVSGSSWSWWKWRDVQRRWRRRDDSKPTT